MRQLVGGAVVLAAGTMAFVTFRPSWWIVSMSAVVIGSGVWYFGRCRHPGPLGLLPPTADEAGGQQPARWFCDRCGQSWPAGFERERTPIYRFAGYDPSKAVAAAKRAEELERKQRELAVKRAGQAGRMIRARQAVEPLDATAEVVPIRRRRFGQ